MLELCFVIVLRHLPLLCLFFKPLVYVVFKRIGKYKKKTHPNQPEPKKLFRYIWSVISLASILQMQQHSCQSVFTSEHYTVRQWEMMPFLLALSSFRCMGCFPCTCNNVTVTELSIFFFPFFSSKKFLKMLLKIISSNPPVIYAAFISISMCTSSFTLHWSEPVLLFFFFF